MSWLRHFLPFGVVRYLQFARQLQDLGIARGRSWRLALDPGMPSRLGSLNLDLFPPGALSSLATVIDVGANTGDWAAAVLAICAPQRIVCIEPRPDLARAVAARFAKEGAASLTECAVGPDRRKVAFNVTSNPLLNSVLRPAATMTAMFPGNFEVEKTIEVDMVPLDSLTADMDRVSLLKVDAQGYEMQVLQGATQTLAKTDYLLVEVNFQPQYEGAASFAEIDGYLRRNGLAISNYSRPRGGRPQALHADVLYVPLTP